MGTQRRTDRRRMLRYPVLAATVFILACGSSSSSKKDLPASTLRGLELVPGTSQVVLGYDVPRLAESKLAQRAVGELLSRDPGLRERLQAVVEPCEIKPIEEVKEVLLALDQDGGSAVMVARTTIPMARLRDCLNISLNMSGGDLAESQVEGRKVFRARRNDREVWIAQPTNIAGKPPGKDQFVYVLTGSKKALGAAIGKGKKLSDNKDLMKLVRQARPGSSAKAGFWGAGIVAPNVGAGLVEVSKGAVSAAPKAMWGRLDLAKGLDFLWSVQMANAKDASALATMAGSELGLASLWAQAKKLGPIVSKVQVKATGPTVTFEVSLQEQELREIIAKLGIDD